MASLPPPPPPIGLSRSQSSRSASRPRSTEPVPYPAAQDQPFNTWVDTLTATQRRPAGAAPTAEEQAELQASLRALNTRFDSLQDEHDARLQQMERQYKSELTQRDDLEHDLRKRLRRAHDEVARLRGERDAYVNQLDAFKPREGRSQYRSQQQQTELHPSAAAAAGRTRDRDPTPDRRRRSITRVHALSRRPRVLGRYVVLMPTATRDRSGADAARTNCEIDRASARAIRTGSPDRGGARSAGRSGVDE